MKPDTKLRNLVIILGDQLDERSATFDGFDPAADAVWMAEVAHESEKVWVAKPRIAIFLATMRHFRDALGQRGWRVFYRSLTEKGGQWSDLPGKASSEESFAAQLAWTIAQTRPERLILGITSSPLIPTRETPTGERPADNTIELKDHRRADSARRARTFTDEDSAPSVCPAQ